MKIGLKKYTHRISSEQKWLNAKKKIADDPINKKISMRWITKAAPSKHQMQSTSFLLKRKIEKKHHDRIILLKNKWREKQHKVLVILSKCHKTKCVWHTVFVLSALMINVPHNVARQIKIISIEIWEWDCVKLRKPYASCMRLPFCYLFSLRIL